MRLRRLALATAALLLIAAPAAVAKPQGEPLRFWSISQVRHGAGARPVTSGSQLGGPLAKQADLGFAAFSFPESVAGDRAFGTVASSADGKSYDVLAQAPGFDPFEPRSPEGGLTHLEQLQAYEKRSDD